MEHINFLAKTEEAICIIRHNFILNVGNAKTGCY